MRNLPYRNLFANKKESQPSRESKDTRRKGYVPSRRTNAPSRRTNVSRRKSYMPSRRTTIPCRRANAPSRKCYAPSQRTAVTSRIRPQRSGTDKVPPVHLPNGLLRFSEIIHQLPRPSGFPTGGHLREQTHAGRTPSNRAILNDNIRTERNTGFRATSTRAIHKDDIRTERFTGLRVTSTRAIHNDDIRT